MGVLAYQLDGVYFGLTQTRLLMASMLFSACLFLAVAHFALVPWLGMIGLWFGYVLFMFSRTATLALGLPYLDRRMRKQAQLSQD